MPAITAISDLCLNFYRGIRENFLTYDLHLLVNPFRRRRQQPKTPAATRPTRHSLTHRKPRESNPDDAGIVQPEEPTIITDGDVQEDRSDYQLATTTRLTNPAIITPPKMCCSLCCINISKSWILPIIFSELTWLVMMDVQLIEYSTVSHPASIVRPAPFVIALTTCISVTVLCLALVGCASRYRSVYPWKNGRRYKHAATCMSLCLCIICACSCTTGWLLTQRSMITPTEIEREHVKITITRQLMSYQPPGQIPSKTEFASRYEPFLLSLVHINQWHGRGVLLGLSSLYHFVISLTLCAMDNGYQDPPATVIVISSSTSPLHSKQRRVSRILSSGQQPAIQPANNDNNDSSSCKIHRTASARALQPKAKSMSLHPESPASPRRHTCAGLQKKRDSGEAGTSFRRRSFMMGKQEEKHEEDAVSRDEVVVNLLDDMDSIEISTTEYQDYKDLQFTL